MGQSEDWLALQMALAPCLLGYGAVAQMLHVHAATQKEGNTYWPWIENYVAEDYTEAVRLGSQLIENSIRECSPSRIEELIKIFIHGTKVSYFWRLFTTSLISVDGNRILGNVPLKIEEIALNYKYKRYQRMCKYGVLN